MSGTRIHFQWSPGAAVDRFATGVSLHSHTLHSRESLDFFYRAAEHPLCCEWRSAGPKRVIYQKNYGAALTWAGAAGHRRSRCWMPTASRPGISGPWD